MRKAYFVTLALFLLLMAAVCVFSPPRIAVREWGVHALVMVGTVLFLTGTVALLAYVISISPAYGFNVPNADYWRREENLPEMKRKIVSFLWELGTYTVLFMCFIETVVFFVHLPQPPDIAMEVIGAGILLTLTVVSFVRLFLGFRLPKTEEKEKT